MSAVDQLPWKVKAIVAQEKRVKAAGRVRDFFATIVLIGVIVGIRIVATASRDPVRRCPRVRPDDKGCAWS